MRRSRSGSSRLIYRKPRPLTNSNLQWLRLVGLGLALGAAAAKCFGLSPGFVHGRLGVTIAVIDAQAGRYAQAVPLFRSAIDEMQYVCESAPEAQHFWGGLAWSWWSAMNHLRGPDLADAARRMRQWVTHVRPSDGVLPQGERLSLMMEVVGYLRLAHLDEEADAFSREVADAAARFVTRLQRSPTDRAEASHLFPMSQGRIAQWLVDHPDPAIAEGSREFQDLARDHVP